MTYVIQILHTVAAFYKQPTPVVCQRATLYITPEDEYAAVSDRQLIGCVRVGESVTHIWQAASEVANHIRPRLNPTSCPHGFGVKQK